MRFFSQSFLYDDPWPIVSLAYFLRYPNPYAAHVISCDVISRTPTPTGTLLTTRLILKRGALPKWAPNGIISRAETWVIEESEVDPNSRVVRCTTRNLDHVKIMQVEESVTLREMEDLKTLQTTQARFISGFGWGLTRKIENHGLKRFQANIQKSREGISSVLRLLRESRLQPLTFGSTTASDSPRVYTPSAYQSGVSQNEEGSHHNDSEPPVNVTTSRYRINHIVKSWLGWG
ncbi:MSF1-domain-containing protein [Rickenella mellea]|uniref:MSF1-domain-containing protein n=1 Tax=Rickenella mellea TaxID=50990 RepID=A0A4Y7QMI8_9AGAM|nr:MSF1-domain-containing protein [Rickenella mellea]